MQRRALLLGLGALGAACGPKQRPALPTAPAVTSAFDLIPPDLDVVLRLDLGRVKSTLGGIAVSALAREVLARGGASGDADDLIVASLVDANVVYLGYRPSPLLAPLDRVLALQGRFQQITATPLGFTGAVDLGADVRYWDFKQGGEPGRGGVARIYAARDGVRAFVSEAEIDAVERVLTGQGAERRLAPPEEGTVSLAARPWLLARLTGRGVLRALVDQAKTLRAVADLESDGVLLKVELVLASAEQATELAAAGKRVFERSLGALAPGSELRAEADRVVLSAKLGRGQLAPALGCLQGSGAACPW